MAEDDDGREDRPASDETRDIQSALEKLNRRDPKIVTEIMATMQSFGPAPNPLLQKLSETHIAQILDLSAKHDERDFTLQEADGKREEKDNQSIRAYGFAAFLVVVALIALVLLMFKDRPNVLIPILTGIGGLIGGGLGGFGLGKTRSTND